MDVAGWLRGLGLARYEAAFREAAIGRDVLPDLTDGDLEKLGIALGDRKRLLRAIGSLRPAETLAQPRVLPPPPRSREGGAERRQLTVMFCDLVGSTALSARLDPEDMREVIRAYQDVCSGAVARYDGFVAKFMGDGVLAYFGFPRAHEDDADRAVRAGLDIAAAVAKLDTPARVSLNVRIGVATGIVVVGDLIGQGSAQEQAVVGETPNLAARLQAIAEPGLVFIAESTQRLLGGAFALKPLGPQVLKGFDAPVPAWMVLREAENVSRFEASRSQSMTPFVGREHEVALLLDRWREASEGEGQVALISGEAGIGKSRILAALSERIADMPHVRVRYQCSPHYVDDAFYPITSHIGHAASFVIGEPAATRLDKLEALLARSRLEAKKIAPLLAALLSIPAEGRYPQLEMAPPEQKERTIAALIALFEGLSKDAPVLAFLEDVHWIDPSSLDVFGRLVNRLPRLRVLLVITFRPEFAAPWIGGAHVASLQLNRFGRRQALAMVDGVAGGKALPDEVLDQIIAKTDGVPLFVEELTKTVLESGLLREESGAYVLSSALTPLAIPSTLQDSLMARLDRLAPVKEIAQIGAAIGREFSYRLLEAAAPIQGPALQDALGQLIAADLIHARGTPPEAAYVFKHALVQDTAYASLLRSRRQRIHADIARALEERLVDQIETAPAIIAHHYTEAGLTEPASRYWLKAAELALSRSAPIEGSRHAEVGLAMLSNTSEGPNRKSVEMGLLIASANASLVTRGYAASETVSALSAAKKALDAGGGTDMQSLSVLFALFLATNIQAQLASAHDVAKQIAQSASERGGPIYRLIAHRALVTNRWYMGLFREALESAQQAELYFDANRQDRLGFRFGYDPIVAVLDYKLLSLMFLGLVDQASRVGEDLRTELDGQEHATTMAASKWFAVILPESLFGNRDVFEDQLEEFVAYCAAKGVEQYRMLGAFNLISLRALRAPTKENIAVLRSGLEALRRSGARLGESVFSSALAEAMASAGDVAGARSVLQEAFAFVEQSGERFWLAELNRLDGQIAIQQPEPDPARAESCFRKAVEIANSQEARLLELRAATDLARLWRDTGSSNDPGALLQPILAAIEGGETTRDVRNARALLAEIA
jgi:class 3 adenylate cyclase